MRYLVAAILCLFTLGVQAQLTSISVEPYVIHDGVNITELDGFTTYHVYANTTSSTDFVSSVCGDSDNALSFSSAGTVYHSDPSYDYGNEHNSMLFDVLPETEWDSWLTIGIINAADNGTLSNIGMNDAMDSFNTTGDFYIDDLLAGCWFHPGFPCGSSTPVAECANNYAAFGGADNKVLLAQITTDGSFTGVFNVRILVGGEVDNNVYYTGVVFSTDSNDVFGCTDYMATNFNLEATVDDLSCIFPCTLELVVESVTSPTCFGGNDGSIIITSTGAQGADDYYLAGSNFGYNFGDFNYLSVGYYYVEVVDGAGCMSSATVTVPEGECDCEVNVVDECGVCGGNGSSCNSSSGSSGFTGFTAVIDTAFSGVDTPVPGDTFDPDGELDGFVTYKVYANFSHPDDVISALFSDVAALGTPEMFIDAPCGCYNPLSTSVAMDGSNSSVFWSVFPMWQYDSYWTIGMENSVDNGVLPQSIGFPSNSDVCSTSISDGSIYTVGAPVNSIAGDDLKVLVAQVTTCGDWSFQACVQTFRGGDQDDIQLTCSDILEISHPYLDGECVNDSDGDGVCNEIEIAGCSEPEACNYDENATNDDGSCLILDECGVCGGDCVSDFNSNGICDDQEIFGCTYSTASNYSPDATSDNGSCEGAFNSCPSDLSGNGNVGSEDLLIFLADFDLSCDEISGQ